MLKKLKKDNKGFTIIEVMIVLAIAGLILLIVFLAVPALQRSARNTQRKNDVAAIGSALSSYSSDNNSTLPSTAGYAPGVLTFSCGGTTALETAAGCSATDTNTETSKVGFYTAPPTFESTPTPPTLSTSTIQIDLGYNCNSSGTGVGTATPHDAAVLYMIEPASTECIED